MSSQSDALDTIMPDSGYRCSSCHDDFPEGGEGEFEIVKVQSHDDLKGYKDQYKCRGCINFAGRTSKIAKLITAPPRG